MQTYNWSCREHKHKEITKQQTKIHKHKDGKNEKQKHTQKRTYKNKEEKHKNEDQIQKREKRRTLENKNGSRNYVSWLQFAWVRDERKQRMKRVIDYRVSE